jgi:hypothetical protein
MEVLMVTQSPVGPVERDSVRLAAVLLLAGVVVTAMPDSFMQKVRTRMTTKPFSLFMRRTGHGRRCISVSSSEW